MQSRFTRLITALLVIGFGSFAVFKGSEIVGFASARWFTEGQPAEAKAQLERWTSVSGLASSALHETTLGQFDLKFLRQRFETIVETRPMSAQSWLALAGLQIVFSEPKDQIINSLTMAVITGPNELYLMPIRGKLGLSLWESLPPERRSGVAYDLVEANYNGYFQIDKPDLLAITKGKSEAVRQDILSQLRLQGPRADRLIQYLGLGESGSR